MICASLLDGAWFYQSEIECLVICCRMKRVRSDFVGSIRKLKRGRFGVDYFVTWNSPMAGDQNEGYGLGERRAGGKEGMYT